MLVGLSAILPSVPILAPGDCVGLPAASVIVCLAHPTNIRRHLELVILEVKVVVRCSVVEAVLGLLVLYVLEPVLAATTCHAHQLIDVISLPEVRYLVDTLERLGSLKQLPGLSLCVMIHQPIPSQTHHHTEIHSP